MEVETLKKIKPVVRPLLQNDWSKRIDTTFQQVKKEIFSAGNEDLATQWRAVGKLLGIKDDLLGESGSFHNARQLLVRRILLFIVCVVTSGRQMNFNKVVYYYWL